MSSIDCWESQATGLGTCVGGNGHLWDFNYKVNANAWSVWYTLLNWMHTQFHSGNAFNI